MKLFGLLFGLIASCASAQVSSLSSSGGGASVPNPLPVSQSGTWNVGSIASIANPIGLAPGSAVIGSIANMSFGATQSGTWTVGINGTVPVSGVFWQALQPVSITGAVSTNDETNTLAGRGFSWGMGVQTIPANNYVNIQFSNPAGSGKTDYIILRTFGNGSTTVLQAVLRTNCTQMTGATVVAGGNRYMTNATTTASTVSYQIGATAISTGTLGPATMLGINGVDTQQALLRIVPPGQNFCYVIQGLTGAFAASAQVSFSVAGWEQ